MVITFLLSATGWPCLATVSAAGNFEERPLVAVWRDSDGLESKSQALYLRIAIGNDGRIVFATERKEWKHELRDGTIDAASLARLKKAIQATGIFKLKGNCYLVPDAPVDCMMIDLGDKQQMLYWDEVETPGYGINSFPKPRHLKFKRSWKEVNKLALAAIPK